MSRKPRSKAASAGKREAVQLELPFEDAVVVPAAPAPGGSMRAFAASLRKRPAALTKGNPHQGGHHDQR